MWLPFLQMFLLVSQGTRVIAQSAHNSICSEPTAPGGNGEWQDGCVVKTCKAGVLEEKLTDECVQLIEKNVEKILAEKLAEKGIECSTENSEILLIGSGSGIGLISDKIEQSYALNLPSLTVANCTPPTFPHEGYYGYVGKMTPNGLLLCGGSSPGKSHSSCSLLSKSGSWETVEEMDMLGQNWRHWSSAVDTDEGWWVTGPGYSSILWDGTAWSNVTEELPRRTSGHCLVRLNSTHVFLTGGTLDYEPRAPETYTAYFYSKETGFVKAEDMPTKRGRHACGLHQGQVVVAGGWGGGSQTSDYFSLDTQTWHSGPKLSRKQGYARTADFVSWNNRAFWVGEKWIWELTGDDTTSWKWETVAEMETNRNDFKAFVIPAEYCRD